MRVGEQVFIVEKLRQQAYRGKLDDEVTIGWDAARFHPGGRLMSGMWNPPTALMLRCERSEPRSTRHGAPAHSGSILRGFAFATHLRMRDVGAFSPGPRAAIPFLALFLVGFVAPLLAVIVFSFMPPRTFSIWQRADARELPRPSSRARTTSPSSGRSASPRSPSILLALICYPVAYGLVRVFGRWSMALTLLFVIPLFVSENVRLYGWVLFLIKNGVLLGS